MKASTLIIIIFSMITSGCFDTSLSSNSDDVSILVGYPHLLQANFQLKSSGLALENIQWEFGDGYQAKGLQVNHTYLSPGSYTSKVKYDIDGATYEISAPVHFSGDRQDIHIQPQNNIVIDSDHNDPNQPFSSNNEHPQIITSPVSLSGFLVKLGGCQAGRLCQGGDELDRYSLNLNYGDNVSIEVLKGSIDIELLDESSGLIALQHQVSNQFTVNENDLSFGQFHLNIHLDAEVSSAQYLVHIGPSQTIKIGNHQPGKVIVLWKDSTIPELVDISDPRLLTSSSDSHFDAIQARKYLSNLSEVKTVSLNYYREALDQTTWQWPLVQQNIDAIWKPLALRGESPGHGVRIAILDSGIYAQHPNLSGLDIQDGYDFVSDSFSSGDGDGWDTNPEEPGGNNSSFHGTHVTGIIAAQSENAQSSQGGFSQTFISGLAWGGTIMPIRVLGQNGGTSYDLIQALLYAAGLKNDSGQLPSQPADIINLSLGGNQFSIAEQATIDSVINSGVIVVAAAGNQGNQQVNYPAAYKNVISVGATKFNGELADYSNYGKNVDILAPGGQCESTNCPSGVLSLTAEGNLFGSVDQRSAMWQRMSGTSMAAAHVTGMLAIARSYLPALDATSTKALINSGQLLHGSTDEILNQLNLDKSISSEKLMTLMDSSQLNKTMVWPSQKVIYTSKNETHVIPLFQRGGEVINEIIADYDNETLSVLIHKNSVEIKLFERFESHQGINFYNGSEPLFSINIYPQASHGLPDFARHLYIELEEGGYESSGFRTITMADYWQAQVPPLLTGQFIQSSTDIDYDGVYCEQGEFCAYSLYHTNESAPSSASINKPPLILKGMLITP